MITNQQFYVYYTDFTILIDKMSDSFYTITKEDIKKLRFLREVFHMMYHIQQTMDNGAGKVIEERHNLITKCLRLEKENEKLKNNINL